MASSDLAAAAGRLITGRLPAIGLDADHKRAIERGIMRGITLFKENVRDVEQLCGLIDAVRDAGGDDFMVAVDQEGGAVQRFDHVLCSLPSALAVAALPDAAPVFRLWSLAAEQLRLLGVNVNLVPVLDINSNPLNPIIGTRSFGDRIDTIVRLASEMVTAYESHGVVCAGKHFPGHGDTAEDSHLKLAVCDADKKLLHLRELKPFALLSKKLKACLVAHVWMKAIDRQPLPASLSPAVVTDLLRAELGFDGFVLSDDLPVMKAIVDHWGLQEACVMAVNAGVDNLLVSGSLEQIEQAHSAIVEGVEQGVISESTVERAAARRRAVFQAQPAIKNALARRVEQLSELNQQMVPLSLAISAAAVAVVKGRIPDLQASELPVIVSPLHPRYDLGLSQHVRRCCALQLEEIRCSLDPAPPEIEQISASTAGKRIIILTFRALLHNGQIKLAQRLAAQSREATAIAVDVPYELHCLRNFANLLATFDPSLLALQGLAEVLAGKERPQGACPVDLSAVKDAAG